MGVDERRVKLRYKSDEIRRVSGKSCYVNFRMQIENLLQNREDAHSIEDENGVQTNLYSRHKLLTIAATLTLASKHHTALAQTSDSQKYFPCKMGDQCVCYVQFSGVDPEKWTRS